MCFKIHWLGISAIERMFVLNIVLVHWYTYRSNDMCNAAIYASLALCFCDVSVSLLTIGFKEVSFENVRWVYLSCEVEVGLLWGKHGKELRDPINGHKLCHCQSNYRLLKDVAPWRSSSSWTRQGTENIPLRLPFLTARRPSCCRRSTEGLPRISGIRNYFYALQSPSWMFLFDFLLDIFIRISLNKHF
jgi:hypothetical protein